ncbi:MAG TPA: type II toxin-antitoxin system RelE/ParE family toxin [Candidatus Binataceae bacterium]|nr:type II toxin-antitoxin system RelE/ParE family toxin [Candidatus Binataceae bacterium]
MPYRVDLTLRAERDLEHLYEWIAAASSIAAARWFNGLEDAILSLERFPRRCAVAPESRRTRRRLRHLFHGAKPDIYRVVFQLDEKRKVVSVLTIRHGAMDELTGNE